jgi:hypothetical protein
MGLLDLADEKYVSLTTFKRDGTPVATPVWVVGDDGHLLVHSAAQSWKVKRIRRDGHVLMAGCSLNGKIHGESFEAEATILDDTARVEALEARKYGFVYRLVRGLTATVRRLRRRPQEKSVAIAIAPPTTAA